MMTPSIAPFCSILLAGALAAQAPAPVPRPVEDLLPASSYACLQFGGLGACARAAAQLPAAEVVLNFLDNLPAATREQQVDAMLDQASEQVRRVLQQQGVAPGDVRALLSCPAAIGVGRPTIEGMGASVALVLAVGEHGDSVRRVFDAAQAMGERHGVLAAGSTGEIAGIAVRSWHIQGGPPIHFGKLAGNLIITNSRGYLQEIAAVAAGQAPCLAADSTLGHVRRQLLGTVLASAFANTAPFCAMADPILPYEMGEWASVLGIGSLQGIFAGLSAGAHGSTDVLHFGLSGDENGLLKVAASKPLDLSLAASCSERTVAFGAVRLDVPALIGAFDRFLDILPEQIRVELRREMQREMTREMRRNGTSPGEVYDVLRAFGDQATFALSLENGAMPKPELLVQLSVRDAQKIMPLLHRLEAAIAQESGLEWKQREVDGAIVRFVNVTIDGQFKLSPCYALTEKALLLGSDTQSLVRALRNEGGDDSLASQDDFVAMQQSMQGAFGVLHLRLFRAAELGWRTVETIGFPQLDAHADEVGFDSSALPDGEEMAHALGTSTMAAFVDGSGYTLKNQGTMGFGTYLAAAATLVDEVLRRASTQSRIY